MGTNKRRTKEEEKPRNNPSSGGQLALFEAGASLTTRPAPRRKAKQLRADIRHWRAVAKWWRDGCPGGHIDYQLVPGTDEGDCTAQYRREMEAEARAHVGALQAEVSR